MPDKFENATLRAKTEQMFCVHTRAFQVVVYFQNVKISYSSWIMDLFMRISVDGSRIRNNKVAFSNLSGIV